MSWNRDAVERREAVVSGPRDQAVMFEDVSTRGSAPKAGTKDPTEVWTTPWEAR